MIERIPIADITIEAAEEFSDNLALVMQGTFGLMEWGSEHGIAAALGLSREEWVQRKFNGPVRLSIAERRQVVSALSADGLSQRQIADVVGVDASTVNRDIAVANATEDEESPQYDAGFANAVVANATLDDEPDESTVWVDASSADDEPAQKSPPDDPPLFSVVDLETGEVVEPEPEPVPDIVDVAYQIADDAGKTDLDRVNFRARLFRDIKHAGLLLSYDPADIGYALTADEIDSHLDGFADQLKQLTSQSKAHIPATLSIVRREAS